MKATLVIVPVLLALASAARGELSPANLRCEYMANPQGIATAQPRLGWIVQSPQRGAVQKAYQVLVASSPEILAKDQGDLWDSGRVESAATAQIAYGGKPLASRQACWWKVRVWDGANAPGAYSPAACWSVGLLAEGDWSAKWVHLDAPRPAEDKLLSLHDLKWIRCPGDKDADNKLEVRYFGKRVAIDKGKKIRSALFVVVPDNFVTLKVNGRQAGTAGSWQRVSQIDMAAALHAGDNEILVEARNSDFLPPALVGKLVIRFEQGEPLVVPLDKSWSASATADLAKARPADMMGSPSSWGTKYLDEIPLPPAPCFRKGFAADKPVRKATVYATALGLYELHLNGQKVSKDYFTPGWSDYRARVYHNTYDVTGMIRKGDNVLGAVLGEGWYAGCLAFTGKNHWYGDQSMVRTQLEITYEDGTTQTIATDDTWKATADGPVRRNDLLMGSVYDARKEIPGWDAPGFDDAAWAKVAVTQKVAPVVQPFPSTTVKAFEQLPAKNVTKIEKAPFPVSYIFDLGQNITGWARLKVSGKPGQKLIVRHGEFLNPDGTLYTANLRAARAVDEYILGGKGEEILEPPFTFHGFRYVEILGLESAPSPEMVTGIVVHSDLVRTGEFECSDPMINQLFRNIIWGQKGNHLEVPTDCPQRDERAGWTGDTQFFMRTGAFNMDVAPFFTNWLVTMCQDSQDNAGAYAHVAPDLKLGSGATAWGDAAVICTYYMYLYYGDTRVIERHFDKLVKYLAWLKQNSKDLVRENIGFGDWLNLGDGADKGFIGTAYFAYVADLMSQMAAVIGRADDAKRFADLHKQIVAKLREKYFLPDGTLKKDSQTSYALAFTMGLLEPAAREAAAKKFVEQVAKRDWHLCTGFIGTPRLLPALQAAGQSDAAYRLLMQKTFPSWLYQVTQGATTMWERWDGWVAGKGFQSRGMNSFNHYAFGAVGEFMYTAVAGIDTDGPGFSRIVIRPLPGGGLTWARARYDSIRGRIESAWKIEGDRFLLKVTVPANVTATICVPAKSADTVTEGGGPAARAPGVKFIRMESGAAVFEVGGGTYSFAAAK